MRKIYKISFLLIILFASYRAFAFFSGDDVALDYNSAEKVISINNNGHEYEISTKADTISNFLAEKKIILGDHDKVIPGEDAKLYPGMKIEIQRAAKIKILADGKKQENYVLGKTVGEALQESQVALSRLDKTDPGLNNVASEGLAITVTRINVEEVVKKEEINFKIITKNDSKLGWRENKIETPGEKGEKEVKYRITYKNGKEISRIILESDILEEPVNQVEVQGTYMKLGKAAKGQGTWYAWKGGLFAASTTLPKGSFAKVTNTANGKSVIVEINDYGPQGKGRIIDLDRVAFSKIASIGAGVIGVKVEPVLN